MSKKPNKRNRKSKQSYTCLKNGIYNLKLPVTKTVNLLGFTDKNPLDQKIIIIYANTCKTKEVKIFPNLFEAAFS